MGDLSKSSRIFNRGMVALSPVLLRFSVFFIGFTGDEKKGNGLFGYDIPDVLIYRTQTVFPIIFQETSQA